MGFFTFSFSLLVILNSFCLPLFVFMMPRFYSHPVNSHGTKFLSRLLQNCLCNDTQVLSKPLQLLQCPSFINTPTLGPANNSQVFNTVKLGKILTQFGFQSCCLCIMIMKVNMRNFFLIITVFLLMTRICMVWPLKYTKLKTICQWDISKSCLILKIKNIPYISLQLILN